MKLNTIKKTNMNTAKLALKKLENAGISEEIPKLFWIGAQWAAPDLHEFLEEIMDCNSGEDFARIFPKVPRKYLDEIEGTDNGDSIRSLLGDYGYDGFVAEVNAPIPYNVRYDESGKVKGYSSSMGRCRVAYAYGDSPALLVRDIIRIHFAVTREEIKALRRKDKAAGKA